MSEKIIKSEDMLKQVVMPEVKKAKEKRGRPKKKKKVKDNIIPKNQGIAGDEDYALGKKLFTPQANIEELGENPILTRLTEDKNKPIKKKIKLLWYGDSPTANTGFGVVSRNILKHLQATGEFEITVLGVQYFEEPLIDLFVGYEMPYKLIAAGNNRENDMFGRKKLINLIINEHFDLVITFSDLQNLITQKHGCTNSIRNAIDKAKLKFQKDVKWMIYTPIDGQLFPWELDPVREADFTFFYTQYGYFQSLKILTDEILNQCPNKKIQKLLLREMTERIGFAYHGIDTNNFYPIDRKELLEFRNEYFGIDPDTFLIINVNRNQPRKMLAHTIEAYAKFKKECPDSMLYLHCRDVDIGGDLHKMVKAYGNPLGIKIADNINIIKGCPVETLNKIYNCADLFVTTTMGEGWGLTITEAMATKTLTTIPPHSSLKEIGAENRSIFVNCNNTLCLHEDFYRIRPLVDTNDLASKMKMIYDKVDQKAFIEIREKAYKWVTQITWEAISKEWFARIMQLLGR